jgi:very-short-patch-repair endonuclease
MRANAKTMRREPTKAEHRVWWWLRDRRFGDFKFRRQVPMGPYILDFYCAELKLAIELDGHGHNASDMSDYDDARTLDLRAHGIEAIRIPNALTRNDDGLAWIEQAVRHRSGK